MSIKIRPIIFKVIIDPLNPLGLPANTVRVRTSDGNPPVKSTGWYSTSYETATLVSGTNDVYDVYKSGTDFSYFLYGSTNVIAVLGANTTGITKMTQMFSGCSQLATISNLFNTSNVTMMTSMFYSCAALTVVPLLDTSSVTDMNGMFNSCTNVESGALALYNQASSQANPPTSHVNVFYNCGSNTVSGAAELAQIPESWGGTGA